MNKARKNNHIKNIFIIIIIILSCIFALLAFSTSKKFRASQYNFGVDINQFNKNKIGHETANFNVLEVNYVSLFHFENSKKYKDAQYSIIAENEVLQNILFVSNYSNQSNSILNKVLKVTSMPA